MVIAADSGVSLGRELGLHIDLVVGDLDSVDQTDLARAVADGAAVERHPAAKDATDLELALLAAIARGGDHIAVAGGGSGRLDHLLGIALLLTDDRWADVRLEWHAGSSVAHVVRGPIMLTAKAGELVSVIPMSDRVEISLLGTRWQLEHERLDRGTTRGISNVVETSPLSIDVHEGVALVIITGEDES
jgi:thiamine pyrophosphokinase